MAFNVRVFGHRGTRQLKQVNPTQYTVDSVSILLQPYEWSQVIVTNGSTPVTTAAVPNDLSTCIRIEVPDNQSIRYEINNGARPGNPVQAGNSSPKMSGVDIFDWGVGWTVSIVEAAGFL